jgi:hypothetical protein
MEVMMPLLPGDKIVLEEAMDSNGVPSTLYESIYASFDAAGFSVTPSGGSPATLLASKTGTAYRVDGFPNCQLKRVEHTSGAFLHWLEFETPAGTQRIAMPEPGNGGGGGGSVAWSSVTDRPTTLSGYGITDAAGISHTHPWTQVTNTLPFVAPMLSRQIAIYANRGANTRTAIGAVAGTPAGTIGNATDQASGFFQPWTTAATANSNAGGAVFTTGAAGADVQLRWLPTMICKFRTGSSLTDARNFVGFSSAALGAADVPSAWSGIVLRGSSSAGDTTWQILRGNGTSTVVSDSLVALAADTTYVLALVAISATSVEVWLGTSESTLARVATLTTTLPADNTSLFSVVQVTTLAAAAKVIWFNRLSQWLY